MHLLDGLIFLLYICFKSFMFKRCKFLLSDKHSARTSALLEELLVIKCCIKVGCSGVTGRVQWSHPAYRIHAVKMFQVKYLICVECLYFSVNGPPVSLNLVFLLIRDHVDFLGSPIRKDRYHLFLQRRRPEELPEHLALQFQPGN